MLMGSTVTGTGVVAGVVHAPVVWLRSTELTDEHGQPVDEAGRDAEAERLKQAAQDVAAGYEARAARAEGHVAEVLNATAALARDRGWLRPATKDVLATGGPATFAASRSIDQFIDALSQLGGLLGERATDLRDIKNRVLARLAGGPEPGLPEPEVPSILFADDLAPADTADLDPELILALATRLGGPTSHTAIIARQRGLPCVVAVTDLAEIPDGEVVLLDGAAGTIGRGVADEDVALLLAADARRREETQGWAGPAVTADGRQVQLLAHVADGATAREAAAGPVEGTGLYRTELGFLGATVEPSVEEQAVAYRQVFEAFGERKVVIRTLDAGTDKPVPFASLEQEPNPALGVRGHRLTKAQPGLLTRQLDAIARAAEGLRARG